ncbi:HNH endonuclease, partial [Mycolicibacterium chitae]|nr:HNH endonuclease [Mycolicibacterium chitae]
IVITTPTGHTYRSKPGAALLFPDWNTHTPAPPTDPAAPPPPPEDSPGRTLKMPRRTQTRAKARAYRIKTERALNDAHVAERTKPPPF